MLAKLSFRSLTALLALTLLSGCAGSASVLLVKGYPSDEHEEIRVVMRGVQTFLPYIHINDFVPRPKRAVFFIDLRDFKTKRDYYYEARPRVVAGHLRFDARLQGDIFNVDLRERDTTNTWNIQLKRDALGHFRLHRETGDFWRRSKSDRLSEKLF